MNHKLSEILCNFLIKTNTIDIDHIDIYIYGFELIFSFIISTLLIVSIGIILNQIIPTFFFMIVFILVRQFTGGLHANTYFKCQLYTLFFYVFVILLSVHTTMNSIYAFVISLPIEIIILYYIAPIDNKYKPLTSHEKRKHRKTSMLLFMSFSFFGAAISFLSPIIANTVFYTLLLVIILMLLPYLTRKLRAIKLKNN